MNVSAANQRTGDAAGTGMVPLGHSGDLPPSGTRVRPGLRLFHDLIRGRLAVETGADALRMVATGCEGGYVSLSLDVPAADPPVTRAIAGVSIGLAATTAPALRCDLRLNLNHAGQMAQFHDTIVLAEGSRAVRFDTRSETGDGARPDSAWVDLILSEPRNFDLTISGLVGRYEMFPR